MNPVHDLNYRCREFDVTTISEALTAYRICAQAEGRSPRTIEWITSSMRYFSDFLSTDRDVSSINANDLRSFIIYLQQRKKYQKHPYNHAQEDRISPQSIETYCRAVRAFFGFLKREELITRNLMEKVKIPKVPKKIVPTFSDKDLETMLLKINTKSGLGFRDYVIMLVLIDTAARVSEIANLKLEDVNLENGYLRVMGKGGKERYIPIGRKVCKALLKYKLKYRAELATNDNFFVTADGRPLSIGRIERICQHYGQKAGLSRCYPHKLRHTSSVLYLRNGGDPFSLQKKLGHTSLQMTRYYCDLADSDVRAQHLRFGVADKLKI